MAKKNTTTIDGNEATASVAHRINDVIAIYPITPSSGMGEMADEWSSKGQRNIWGTIPSVTEMQSEAGAAGAVHGALQAGALSTTFTASQGLLLMIPNMYKIAGELTAYCMHVTARTVATHALSIFGDHSDVMACRQIGFGLLSSGSVQEAHDFACLGQAASLESRVPFLHFFDGFRTSHEVASIEKLTDDDLRHMIDDDLVQAHRDRAMTPDRPVLRGTAQNPDAFFQAREACNPYYDACPAAVEKVMNKFAARTGRQYHLFDYTGDPQAERVIMLMGSGAQPAQETAEYLAAKGERVGVVTVRLYRPVLAGAPVEGVAQMRQGDCGARSYQGARCPWRAFVPRRDDRGARGGPDRHVSAGFDAADHRRAVRAFQQGLHPGHGQGRLRRAGQGQAQAAIHRGYRGRRHPPVTAGG